MNDNIKQRCIDILHDSSDEGAKDALVEAVAAESPDMANHLRQFRETGQSYPYGFMWTADGVELLGTQYIIVRTIPKAIAVRFACECARQVLPYIEEAYPTERSPRELIVLTEVWLSRNATKSQIKAKLAEVNNFASRIHQEWHTANNEGKFDSMSKSEFNLSQRPLAAINVVAYAAQSVGLSSSRIGWLISIDETVSEHIDVESIGKGKRGIKRAKEWQLKRLAELIEEADC